jgi:hypothetical protein
MQRYLRSRIYLQYLFGLVDGVEVEVGGMLLGLDPQYPEGEEQED